MRSFISDYEMKTEPTLEETLKTLSAQPGFWKIFAGGTDLMVLFEAGKLQHKNFLNITSFKELQLIQSRSDEIHIGALATYSQIQAHPIIQQEFPLVVRSGWVTGAKAIQNRGTLGGNIANASPAADTPPSLLAYGAQVELMSLGGTRRIPYEQFHLDYKKTQLRADEIISAVILPRAQNWTHHYYRKVGTRSFQSISKAAFSAAAQIENRVVKQVQIGLASVGPTPLRALVLEKLLIGQKLIKGNLNFDQALVDFEKSVTPLDDIRSTAVYRKTIVTRVAKQFIECLAEKPGVYAF